MRRHAPSIFFLMTVRTANRILAELSMSARRRFEKKRIRTVCGKPLQRERFRLWQQTSAALHWSRKQWEKMILQRFREVFREYRQEGKILYTYGVREGKITVEQMCRLLSENPAKLYGVYPKKGALLEGSDGDIVVFDPEKESVISAKTHAYNTDNNPFEGFALHGEVDKVFLRGNLVVEDGAVVKEKTGKYMKRGKRQM